MINPINLSIPGPGPYGFRLSGGDAVPLAVAKLRAKSKASELGLREGDVVLGINGRSCQSLSHADAVKLLTSSDDRLDLYIARDLNGPLAINEAFQKLQAVLRPLSPQQHHLPSKPASEATSSFSCYIHSAGPGHQGSITTNWSSNTTSSQLINNTESTEPVVEPQFFAEIAEREQKKQQFLQQAKQHPVHQIYVEPQDFQRKFSLDQETIVYRHVPNFPQQNISSEINERPRKSLDGLARKEPELNGPKSSRGATTAVSLSWQQEEVPDVTESKTDDQKAVSPLPYIIPYGSLSRPHGSTANFRVSQISATPWVWRPAHGFQATSKPMDEFTLNKVSLSNALLDELIAKHSPNAPKENEEESDTKRLHLIKILTSLEEEGEDSAYNFSKKKIFADSSFYDDPEHTYPTIEEQIKMARKVALSLTAPGNVTARGHRMFMKRKERSKYWNIDNPAYKQEASRERLYYNPSPWLSSGVKKPETSSSDRKHEDEGDFLKNKQLASNRYPRKFEPRKGKSNDNVGARVNFSLSDELVDRKSKGRQLFEKRRAKSEEPGELPAIQKYDSSHFTLQRPLLRWTETLEPVDDGPQVPCRLKEMIRHYEIMESPYYTGIGLGRIDFSSEISPVLSQEGWTKESSSKGKGGRSKFADKSSKSYGPVPYGSSRRYGSVPALHSSTHVGPVTDF